MVIVIRITAWRVSMALVALGGKTLASTECALAQGDTSTTTVNVVSAVVAAMRSPYTVVGVSVSFPGRVVQRDGLVSVPALKWIDDPLEDRLTRELGLPVHVLADSVVAAAFENTRGAGRGFRSVVHLYGDAHAVGGTLALSGELHTGASGRAGNFGHMTVRLDGAPCSCGGSGCLESEVFRLIDSGGTLRPADAAQLVSHITQSIQNAIDPDRIIFHGSMVAFLEAFEQRASALEPPITTLVAARGTPTDLAIGAADIAFETFLDDPLALSQLYDREGSERRA